MHVVKRAWKLWRALGKKLSVVYAYIIYGLFYIILMLIPGIIATRFFDILRVKLPDSNRSNFNTWPRDKETLEQATTQF
jgi:hypothetical protein